MFTWSKSSLHMYPWNETLAVQSQGTEMVQHDSGKLETLAGLLWKLKVEGEQVLILTQVIAMLDILELFLNFHFLINTRQHNRRNLIRQQTRKMMECYRNNNSGVSHTDVIIVVFCDIDLDLLMDTKSKGWCDKIATGRDIHLSRLVSGNSVEEGLLKKSIKHLIQELAAH
ncbi:E1A-binding protein p400-like isoform 1-T2 [Cyanocitta cristata]